MENLFIGSAATSAIVRREPVDTDRIMTFGAFEKFQKNEWDSFFPASENRWVFVDPDGEITEVEIAWEDSSAAHIMKYVADRSPSKTKVAENATVDINVSLMLKLSHRYLKDSPHFHKTRNDIKLLREAGAKLDSQLTYILGVREKETYTYELPKLDRSKDEFFVDTYLFDHDSLHEAVSIGLKPAYQSFQIKGAEVQCDMNRFEGLPLCTKLEAVYEETAVLALERSFIPFGTNEQVAFEMALEKVCTSITSGRFREFAWENYDRVIEMKKEQTLYTSMFFAGIVSGTVKPQGEKYFNMKRMAGAQYDG